MVTLIAILLGMTFVVSRHKRSQAGADLGTFSAVTGRVEIRSVTGHTWINPVVGDIAASGVDIRVGRDASATIESGHHQIVLGPNTDISSSRNQLALIITLQSGELQFKKTNGETRDTVATDFGNILTDIPSSFIVSRPAGALFAVVTPQSAIITVEQHGVGRPIKPDAPPVVLASKHVAALWLLEPAPEIVLPSVEGHAPVIFSWGEARNADANALAPKDSVILIRNLTTGEMTTYENVHSQIEYTLPAGSFSWVVTSGDVVSSTRRFHISSSSAQVAKQASELPPAPKTIPPEIAPQESAAEIPEPVAEPVKTEAPKTETESPEPTVPSTVKLILPHKGLEIPFSKIAEQRIQWLATGQPESFELDILGSSGNPSLHFTLLGHRTRQKLQLLPPGRYSVRMRAVTGKDEAKVTGEWADSFFDVIQTEIGQLSPQNVRYERITISKNSVINVNWDKGAAPQYRVKMMAINEPATIVITKKQKVSLRAQTSSKVVISVCALDANKQIRGCAPDVSIP